MYGVVCLGGLCSLGVRHRLVPSARKKGFRAKAPRGPMNTDSGYRCEAGGPRPRTAASAASGVTKGRTSFRGFAHAKSPEPMNTDGGYPCEAGGLGPRTTADAVSGVTIMGGPPRPFGTLPPKWGEMSCAPRRQRIFARAVSVGFSGGCRAAALDVALRSEDIGACATAMTPLGSPYRGAMIMIIWRPSKRGSSSILEIGSRSFLTFCRTSMPS